MAGQPLEDQVEAAFAALTDSQKRVAQCVVRNPEEVAFLTLDELAARAEVSTTTVLRFARAVGYAGFSDFQAVMQERLRAKAGLPQRLSSSALGVDDDPFGRAFQRDIASIEATAAGLSRDVLHQAVELLVGARNVYVIGMRGSHAPAHFAAAALSEVLNSVHLLGNDFGMFPEQVAAIREDDVCLAFSFPRYYRLTAAAARESRRQGAKVIAICDSPLAPLAAQADLVLPCQFEGVSFKNSMVAPLSLVNGLVAAVAVKARERSLGALSHSERLLKEWDYFV
ncbi:MAG: MurR/RpiR family transcriptional regulator [Chloroflexota bacterium]